MLAVRPSMTWMVIPRDEDEHDDIQMAKDWKSVQKAGFGFESSDYRRRSFQGSLKTVGINLKRLIV